MALTSEGWAGMSSGAAQSDMARASASRVGQQLELFINQPTSTATRGTPPGSRPRGLEHLSGYRGPSCAAPGQQTLIPGNTIWAGDFHSTSSIIVGVSQSYLGMNQVATWRPSAHRQFSRRLLGRHRRGERHGGNWNLGWPASQCGSQQLALHHQHVAHHQNVSLIPTQARGNDRNDCPSLSLRLRRATTPTWKGCELGHRGWDLERADRLLCLGDMIAQVLLPLEPGFLDTAW